MPPCAASLFHFDFYEPLPIQVEVSDAPLTSDAGLLPLRQFDGRIGLTAQFAAALHDPRDPDRIDHTFPAMVRSRVFGIPAGYPDQNDHDTLRTDPVFELIADRSPEDDDLASQPTLSRFENQIDIPSPFRLRDVLIDGKLFAEVLAVHAVESPGGDKMAACATITERGWFVSKTRYAGFLLALGPQPRVAGDLVVGDRKRGEWQQVRVVSYT